MYVLYSARNWVLDIITGAFSSFIRVAISEILLRNETCFTKLVGYFIDSQHHSPSTVYTTYLFTIPTHAQETDVIVSQVLDELGISLDQELSGITPGLDRPRIQESTGGGVSIR